MCGIFGIAGGADVSALLVEGLTKLEYRGYDSCGIVLLDDEESLNARKGSGEVALVAREERFHELHGRCGLGHTRWATHGRVSRINAHPHFDSSREIAIVHNGILENYAALRIEMETLGYVFSSETDSEVIAHLIAAGMHGGDSLKDSILRCVRRLTGTFAVGVISSREPGVLYAARMESPLIVGIGDEFNCFASDPLAFSSHTTQVAILEDGELVRIDRDGVQLFKVADGRAIERASGDVALESRDIELSGYPDYMSKEIHENAQVTRIANSLPEACIDAVARAVHESKTTFLTGIGTSYYVAVMAQYAMRRLTGRFMPALSSDELPYLASFSPEDHIIAISQSGETYDTLKALRQCKPRGTVTSAVLNVASSSMAREVDHVIVQGAGPEICVLSTKSTISQLVIFLRIALKVGELSGRLSTDELIAYHAELERLPGCFDHIWSHSQEQIRDLARPLSNIRNWFFIGRGIYHGLALEAALKFKEVTYCHAEGMPAGALKHGTISLIDETHHSAIFLPSPSEAELRAQSIGAVNEINARNGSVIAFQPSGTGDPEHMFLATVEHPDNGSLTNPLLALMQAQLFAYYTARALGRNVDKPRNLAKSVTVG